MKKTILLFAFVVGIAAVLPSCCTTCAEKHKAAKESKAACCGDKAKAKS